MQIIKRETAVYTMDKENAPVARAASGETLVFETADCFGGQIQKPTDRMGALDWSRINPATGPVFVEDAAPGDTLKVEILNIDLAARAAVVEAPGEGVTGLAAKEETTKILPIQGGCAVFNDRLSLPLCPMIGVIGTAPAGEAVATGTPSFHGGNMDCKRIGAGATLYLPVNVEGALLAMGDLHAVMGRGDRGRGDRARFRGEGPAAAAAFPCGCKACDGDLLRRGPWRRGRGRDAAHARIPDRLCRHGCA